MTEQAFDLRRAFRAIRRRWVLLVALVLASSAVALVHALRQSATYVGRSQILLPPLGVDATGRPLRNTTTEVRIARSTEILAGAGQALTPPRTAASLRPHIGVRAVSLDIVEVRAGAGSAAGARQLVDAVAKEYVSFSNGVKSDQTDGAVAVLKQRASDLERQVKDLDAEISRGVSRLSTLDQRSAERLRQAALVDELRASSVDASRQLLRINTQVADARLAAALGRSGTRIVEGATAPRRPSSPRPVRDAVGGALAGGLVGVVLALALEGNDRRLRTRDQIAEVAAAPVVASLATPRRGRVADCEAVLAQWEPTLPESLALRQALLTLRSMGDEPVTNLVVVTLAGDAAGPLVACQLAAYAAAMGNLTVLIVAAQHVTTDQLRSACKNFNSSGSDPRPNLEVVPEPERGRLQAASLVVTVLVADGKQVLVPRWGRPTAVLLAMSAGFVVAEDLASVAVGFIDAGYPVRVVMVANPDPGDWSTGWQVLPWPTGNGHRPAEASQARRKAPLS